MKYLQRYEKENRGKQRRGSSPAAHHDGAKRSMSRQMVVSRSLSVSVSSECAETASFWRNWLDLGINGFFFFF